MQIICTIVFFPSVSLPTSKRQLMAVYKHPSCTRMARLEAQQSVFSDFLFIFYIWKHSNRCFQDFFFTSGSTAFGVFQAPVLFSLVLRSPGSSLPIQVPRLQRFPLGRLFHMEMGSNHEECFPSTQSQRLFPLFNLITPS